MCRAEVVGGEVRVRLDYENIWFIYIYLLVVRLPNWNISSMRAVTLTPGRIALRPAHLQGRRWCLFIERMKNSRVVWEAALDFSSGVLGGGLIC